MICRKCGREVPDGPFCLECGTKQAVPERKPKMRGNGQGSVYKTPSGKWQCEVRNPRRTKGGFKTKKEALAYIPILIAAPSQKVSTIEKHYKAWSESSLPKLGDSKQTAYRIAYDKIPKALKCRPMNEITIENLQAIIDGMTYYPARDIKTLLSHLYKRACAQGEVPANLSQYMELPDLEEAEQIPFTMDEVNKLWESYVGGDKFAGYILLMIYSGMMPGELLKCRREWIDFEKQVIIGGGIKTKKRKATPIVLADCIVPVLADICGKEKIIHINKDRFYEQYYAALERAGVRALRPYSCRHTTATALAEKIPPAILKEVMRHTKFSTTQRYIHPDFEQTLSAVNKI